MCQTNRQAVTNSKVRTRLEDCKLGKLPDRRGRRGRQYSHRSLVGMLMLGAIARCETLRETEELSDELAGNTRRWLRAKWPKISDTKVRDTLGDLQWDDLSAPLHRQVYAEHRRRRLEPIDGLPIRAVAIDGKCVGIVEPSDHPLVQNVDPDDGEPYGKLMVHRATLISSSAPVCIHQQPIPGASNEIGTMAETLEALEAAYGRTSLFELVMVDAGNISKAVAGQIIDHGNDYWAKLDSNQPTLLREAVRRLGGNEHLKSPLEFAGRPIGEEVDETGRWTTYQGSNVVEYELRRATVPEGFHGWGHLRQMLRIDRYVDGEHQGTRFFVTSLSPDRLATPKRWLKLARRYWRCENGNHWTCDYLFDEDAAQTPWSTDPEAILVATFFRLIALNILAGLRAMSRRDYHPETPPWKTVVGYAKALFQTGQAVKVGACG